jgi:2-amino-4-hydroxy-6-hydroxymethyldihydropteridine diphosphokinase
MNRAVVGVGSNIDPVRSIRTARDILAGELNVVAESRFVTTKAIDRPDHPDFVNGVWVVETRLDQLALEQYLKEVEARMGRRRTADKYAPRTIDLDIVAWNGHIVDGDYHERDFLWRAAREVCPELPGPAANP